MRGCERVGFLFLCPHCKVTTLYCAVVGLGAKEQMQLINKAFPKNGGDVVLAKDGLAWKITGSMAFDAMTVTPSIDASASGHWHGWIKEGEAQ